MADDKGQKDVDSESEDNDDPVGDLGGIFGVASSGKKKKKKKKKAAEAEASEASEATVDADDSIPFPAEEASSPEVDENAKTTIHTKDDDAPKKKKKKKAVDEVAGILTASNEESNLHMEYLNEEDLGDYNGPKSKTVPILVGVIVLMVLAMVGMGVAMTDSGGDLVALFKGELKEKRIQEAKMEEEAFKKEQLDKLFKFGNLLVSGNPKYASIKLNGRKHFGRTTSGQWREIRIGAMAGVQNLKIKDDHEIEVSSPGYETKTFQLTEGMWKPGAGGEYLYAYTASLSPESVETKQEFDIRLGEDPENEFYGSVSLNTIPSGAKITFNTKPLLNEKGEELVTPVTFDKYYVKDEKTGKLEEKQIRVDATIDIGNKIELEIPYENSCPTDTAPEVGKADGCCPAEATVATDTDCKHPRYVEALQRQMWTCEWVDGKYPEKIDKKKTVQHYCNYAFKLDVDFNGLKNYIIERHEELERIKKQVEELQKKQEAKMKGEETASK